MSQRWNIPCYFQSRIHVTGENKDTEKKMESHRCLAIEEKYYWKNPIHLPNMYQVMGPLEVSYLLL